MGYLIYGPGNTQVIYTVPGLALVQAESQAQTGINHGPKTIPIPRQLESIHLDLEEIQ